MPQPRDRLHREVVRLILPVVLLLFHAPPSRADTGWVSQASPTSAALYSVCFLDADHGWIAGDDGTILVTTDGGGAWTAQTSNTAYHLRGIGFSDPDHGIAVGYGGTILRTTDGGSRWDVIRTDWMDGFTGLHVLDSQRAWACGSNAIFQPWVARTTNGGADWSFYSFYIQNNEGSLHDIFFLDASTGFAAASLWDGSGAVVRSTDGGATWSPAIVTPMALLSLDFADGQSGLASGIDGTLYRSTNAGVTWSAIPSGTVQWLYGVSFPAATTASIVGDAGTILRSTDGGLNWTPQQAPTLVPLQAVDFIDLMVGTAVGASGTILRTETGGESGAGIDGLVDGRSHDPAPSDLMLRPGPNPFRDATTLAWDLAAPASVSIEIVDPAGRRIRSVTAGPQPQGRGAWEWDGRDDQGRIAPRGAYLCRLRTGPTEEGTTRTRMLIFLGR